MRLSPEELTDLIVRIFMHHGMSAANANPVASVVMQAERDASFSHGIFRIPALIKTLKSGYVDFNAIPEVCDFAPSVVRVNARNGFAQPAIAAGSHLLVAKVRKTGLAAMTIKDSHHFAALWPDVEQFISHGLVAMTFVSSRPRVAPWDANKRLLGTNPMAFGCPRQKGFPFVWDQASSVMAQGQVLVAIQEGRQLGPGMMIDSRGEPTTDPLEITKGGALRSFGGHKGSAIALMVEIMAAGLSGASFGYEEIKSEMTGAATQKAGQCILVLDPQVFGVPDLAQRVSVLMGCLREGGVSRFPSESRYRARRENARGIPIRVEEHQQLLEFAGAAQ